MQIEVIFFQTNCKACLRILSVKYYSGKFGLKTKLKNCLLLLEGLCNCKELEPAEI